MRKRRRPEQAAAADPYEAALEMAARQAESARRQAAAALAEVGHEVRDDGAGR